MSALLLLFIAQASALDAPVTQQPTVRSEIRNGYDTAAPCDTYDISAAAVDPCITRIVTAYRINHPSAAAFIAGANARRWIVGARFVEVAASLPKNSLAQDYARYGQLSAMQGESDLTSAARDLGISAADVFDAAGVIPENRPTSAFPPRP